MYLSSNFNFDWFYLPIFSNGNTKSEPKKLSLLSNTLHNFVPVLKKCIILLYPYSVRSITQITQQSELGIVTIFEWLPSAPNSRNWHLPTTKLGQLPSAQQLGSWLMTLGLCPFYQSCECFFLICWWKSLHFLTLINQQAQPLHLCLARVVGVFTSFNLSSFNSTSSWNAKSGSEPLPLADFALDNATNRVPGFFASNSYFPGWITTSRKASPMPTISQGVNCKVVFSFLL